MMHAASTYMLLDIGGSLWGTIAFATAMLAPGYLLGRALNVSSFRSKSEAERLAWSVALSFAVSPFLIVAATWLTGVSATAGMLAVASGIAAWMFLRIDRRCLRARRGHLLFSAWAVFVTISLVDIGSGSHLWMSVTTFDHSVRVPFVDAVMRTGVVPVNPLYWPGHDAPLRYYYFWYVVCGVVAKLAHISARQALIASCVWPPVGVVAMLGLYGRHVLKWRGALLHSRVRLATAFMAITGLDVLIAILVAMTGGPAGADMEWWSVDQVSSWLDAFLWVPHHVAALICCLLAYLCLWQAQDERRRERRCVLGLLAGLGFASAFGLSTFVALGFCFIVALWILRLIVASGNKQCFDSVGIAGLSAAVLLTPYVLQLAGHGPSGEQKPHVLSFQIRQILQPGFAEGLPGIASLHTRHPFAQTQLSALILLLPGYLIELGFFAVVLLRMLRRRDKTEGERTLLFLVVATLLSVSFLRSTVIATNDYGSRATLFAQFCLLLLAVPTWEDSHKRSRWILAVFAFVGISGSLYQAVLLRTYLAWQQMHGNPKMLELSDRNYALRDAYQQLSSKVPLEARIQYGAPAGGFFDGTHTLNIDRQIIAAGTTGLECNTGFGGEVSACAPIRHAGAELYFEDASHTGSALSPTDAVRVCRSMGAQYLVATRWDPIWAATSAWPWRLPIVVATPHVRVVTCRAE